MCNEDVYICFKEVVLSKIRCIIRQNEYEKTPEELVRQKILHWLIHSGIAKAHLHVEVGLGKWNIKSPERADILISQPQYDLHKGEFWGIVECKAPGENLENALYQVQRYQQSIRFHYVILTDGDKIEVYDTQNSWEVLGEFPNW